MFMTEQREVGQKTISSFDRQPDPDLSRLLKLSKKEG